MYAISVSFLSDNDPVRCGHRLWSSGTAICRPRRGVVSPNYDMSPAVGLLRGHRHALRLQVALQTRQSLSFSCVSSRVTVGSRLSVGRRVTVGSRLSVGSRVTVISRVSVGSRVTVGSRLSVGSRVTVGSRLSVGSRVTVGSRLSAICHSVLIMCRNMVIFLIVVIL